MADAGPSPQRRPTFIKLRMDEMLQQYQQRRRRRWLPACSSCAAGEGVARCCNFTRFSLVCCAGAFNAMAPWALAVAEAVTVLLIYFLAVPDALITHKPLSSYHYEFDASCEDIVALSLLRSAVVLVAYLLGSGPQYQRPYLYTALAAGAVGLPFVLVKAVRLHDSTLARMHWTSHLTIYATNAGFGVAHMLAAQRVVAWAQTRYEMGLVGFGYPFEEGEETWLLAGQLWAGGEAQDVEGNVPAVPEVHDLPADALADEDSHFLDDCQGLRVHYKVALPQGTVAPGDAAILLVHGFGGGAFSWRHIMQPLADATGQAVVAFDRPGFGLTSRPEVAPKTPPMDNPYSVKSQAVLTLKVAWQLGLHRVLLVGHEDGALVALMAAAMACREEQRFSWSPEPAQPPTPAQPPFPPCGAPLSPLSAALPLGPAIPQSMDAAWEGYLKSEKGRGFLQRLLKGDFSPSPTDHSLLGRSSSLRPPPWAAQRGGLGHAPPWQQQQQQQQQQQWQQRWQRFSMDSFGAWHEEDGPGCWQQRASAAHEEACPILPRSIDTSPPHSVASHASSAHGARQEPQRQLGPSALSGALAAAARSAPAQQRMEQPGGIAAVGEPPSSPETPKAAGPREQCWQHGHHPAQHDPEAACWHLPGWQLPLAVGLVLLHPDLSGKVGPRYIRVLGNSRLGRRVLRNLLRTEVGEVSNHRAWADDAHLTPELLQLYKGPLQVVNWDRALVEACRASSPVHSPERNHLLGLLGASGLPVLVMTGERDHVSPPLQSALLSERLPGSRLAVLPGCGHLAHEECPAVLLDFLAAFVRDVATGGGEEQPDGAGR